LLVVALLLDLEVSVEMEELEYAAAMDSLLDLMAKEFLLHAPYLQVLLVLFHDLDLQKNMNQNTKKLFSISNYF
jgi:hypothetical protein